MSVNSRFVWWRVNVSGWTANNQTLFQANDSVGTRLPLVYVAPAQLNLSKTVSSTTPAAQFVGADCLWNVEFTDQSS
ncbi:hypothetical protein ACFFLM_23675 [Deinococcus oregonensis]|uniref:Uncharacterized protein n=1 Tax=Deinococcus oregonensis TaxID=1805970 RepID=A0ABV6B5B5_9DEIO